MEDLVIQLIASGVATDLLVQNGGEDMWHIGIRLRTFGKQVPKDLMVLAEGETFLEALEAAVEKARAKRWERLDWSARPWTVKTRDWAGGQFGL